MIRINYIERNSSTTCQGNKDHDVCPPLEVKHLTLREEGATEK